MLMPVDSVTDSATQQSFQPIKNQIQIDRSHS
jgi:hypothetical protein